MLDTKLLRERELKLLALTGIPNWKTAKVKL